MMAPLNTVQLATSFEKFDEFAFYKYLCEGELLATDEFAIDEGGGRNVSGMLAVITNMLMPRRRAGCQWPALLRPTPHRPTLLRQTLLRPTPLRPTLLRPTLLKADTTQADTT